jgi:geranylgeranyl diphosphate synthase type II
LISDRLNQILEVFNHMVVLLCEGQAMDADFETATNVSVDRYFSMIDRKTAALIEASLKIGALLGSASPDHVRVLGEFGRDLGRAFQLQDDVLDLTASDDAWGKPIGGDLVAGKKTYILLRALEIPDGNDRSFFRKIVENGGLGPAEVPKAVERLERNGVIEDARRRLDAYYGEAMAALETLPPSGPVAALAELTRSMRARVH